MPVFSTLREQKNNCKFKNGLIYRVRSRLDSETFSQKRTEQNSVGSQHSEGHKIEANLG